MTALHRSKRQSPNSHSQDPGRSGPSLISSPPALFLDHNAQATVNSLLWVERAICVPSSGSLSLLFPAPTTLFLQIICMVCSFTSSYLCCATFIMRLDWSPYSESTSPPTSLSSVLYFCPLHWSLSILVYVLFIGLISCLSHPEECKLHEDMYLFCTVYSFLFHFLE